MNDMSSVIVPKSDQINADDLLGRTMDITVTNVQIRGGQEQPVSLFFDGSDKAFRPCKSMCRVLVQAWGLDAKQYVGKSMRLYCDPTVKFGPLAVGGIRISHMSHIDGPMVMALTATKGVKKAYKVMPLVADQKADKVTDGVRALIARIEEIGSDYNAILAEPAVIKQRAWLAANRPELAKLVDDAIPTTGDDPFVAVTGEVIEGRTDEQHGETHNDTPDPRIQVVANDIITRAENATTAKELTNLAGVLENERASFTQGQIDEVEMAISDARARL